MDVLSAAASDPATGRAGLVVVVLLTGYLAACACWPFTSCARCNGTGKLRSPSGRSWRPCPRCHGTGTRVRLGRRAWGAIRHRPHNERTDRR